MQSIQKKPYVLNVRNMYSMLIALLPVIMVLNVPFLNFGLSTLVLGLFAPFAVMHIRLKHKQISFIPVAIMLGYFFIRATGSMLDQFLLIIVFVHVLGAVNGSLNKSVIRKTLEIVAVAGTGCVLFQTILHYVAGIQFSFLIPDLVLAENRAHVLKSAVYSGMYRPSAFFLEPSHYAQYCCLALLMVLFPEDNKKADIKKALWITLGCVLTTSGMGIALCIGVFGWYVLFTKRKKGTKIQTLLGWTIAAVIAFAILMQIPFFAQIVQRVFGEVDGYNAIWGRTLYWDVYITPMTGMKLLFGNGRLDLPEGYMTGLMNIIYCYGYVGVALMLIVFLHMFIRSKSNIARCQCVLYCAISCVAGLTGFILLTFWLSLIISMGLVKKSNKYAM